MISGALFCPDRVYRYALWRYWTDDFGKPAVFIGLNPSTADEHKDDPTVRRCIKFAKDWGYSGMYMLNLFALRATDPRVMMSHHEPVGRRNDEEIVRYCGIAGIVIAAWGNHGKHLDRDAHVLRLIPNIHHLGLTKSGCPRHPLYLRATTEPMRLAA